MNELKNYYQILEDSYFELEKTKNEKVQELDNEIKSKEEDKQHIENIYRIYKKHDIDYISLNRLKELENKIMNCLKNIKIKKQESNFNLKIVYEKSSKKKVEDMFCVVCYENEVCIMIKPCNHLCICVRCSKKMNTICPMCRENIIEKEFIKF